MAAGGKLEIYNLAKGMKRASLDLVLVGKSHQKTRRKIDDKGNTKDGDRKDGGSRYQT